VQIPRFFVDRAIEPADWQIWEQSSFARHIDNMMSL